jgi:DNA repair exonuclease SbcCD ATPase subunit
MTEKVSKHLEGLGNPQIKVIFSTTKQLKSGEERDEFTCDIRSSSGGSGYDSLSGGEQQIVSFAVGLALADLAESQAVGISRILILDEPFMSLDQRNAENLIHYMVGTLAQRRETILLISNEDNLKSLVPANIHIIKQNGVSSICQ